MKIKEAAQTAYNSIVDQSRKEIFYTKYKVPDSLDGRFELIVLHLFLTLNPLKVHEAGFEFSQYLLETFIDDMDACLREFGTGDLSVPKKIKEMAEAFYGRSKSYEYALASGEGIEECLERNLYGTTQVDPETLQAITKYVVKNREAFFASDPTPLLKEGEITFQGP